MCSGEQVVYEYDALNRLASATAMSGSWGQSYSYDGFGNLTAQNVTAGSAPAYSPFPTRPRIMSARWTLRANIDETESAAIITEQGGQENHRERSQDGSSFCNQFA